MSIPKQIAVVIGITVVTAALGYVSWRILLLGNKTLNGKVLKIIHLITNYDYFSISIRFPNESLLG
jgi:hypothetical protein